MNLRAGLFACVSAALCAFHAWADAAPAPDTLPGAGFDGDRYANLWTKSPFAVATPDAPAASEDYALVGVAQFDGISYVSLIDKQAQGDHFVLSSDKPIKDAKRNLDLKLISIARGPAGASAVIQRNGESLTLHQEEAPATASSPVMPGSIPLPQPGFVPSPNPSVGGMVRTYNVPPRVRIHRFPPIRVPPSPPSQ
jgi:hypothetical protein